jgi:serine protease
MLVLAEATPGTLANHYVLLLDSTSDEVVGPAAEVEASTGAFSMDGIPAGEYYLIAGSDMDNDNYIGDTGEASGAYLSLDNPVALSIDANRSGLDFVTVFRLALPGTLPSGNDTKVYSFSKPGIERR